MPLKELNATRRRNYITMFLLLLLFTFSLYSINIIYPKLGKSVPIPDNIKKAQEIGRFAIPFMTLLSFFTACVVVATMISDGNSSLLSKPRDQFAGIYFLGIAGVILSIMNFTVLKEHNLKDYIKGKKFSVIGIPITHSLSPKIHKEYAKQQGITIQYKMIEPDSDEHFETHAQSFFSKKGYGANITIPFKEKAFSFADIHDNSAIECGCANTLLSQDNKINPVQFEVPIIFVM